MTPETATPNQILRTRRENGKTKGTRVGTTSALAANNIGPALKASVRVYYRDYIKVPKRFL